jgi:hypothetical protein
MEQTYARKRIYKVFTYQTERLSGIEFSKYTLLVLYGNEINNFIKAAETADFIRLSDDSILLFKIVKNRIHI